LLPGKLPINISYQITNTAMLEKFLLRKEDAELRFNGGNQINV
jgi:hypothetical protein